MHIISTLIALAISPLAAETADRADYGMVMYEPKHATFEHGQTPCIKGYQCEWTEGFDPVVTKVEVKYYGDLGEPITWIRQVHSGEKITSCEKAAEQFPHPFFKQCEGPIVTPASLVVDEPVAIE